jgi:hypothetical protein
MYRARTRICLTYGKSLQNDDYSERAVNVLPATPRSVVSRKVLQTHNGTLRARRWGLLWQSLGPRKEPVPLRCSRTITMVSTAGRLVSPRRTRIGHA